MKEKRERFNDQQKRVYDPEAEMVVGRDSPGSKYNTLVTIGNPEQRQNSQIKKSKFYSMPKQERKLKFNSANGQGADVGSCSPETSTFKHLKINAVFGRAERKFSFPVN